MKNTIRRTAAALLAALVCGVPVYADATITEPLDFTEYTGDASGANWNWKNNTRTLTLKKGFKMDIMDLEESTDAITVPPGTTVIVEGDAEISAGEDAIQVNTVENEMDRAYLNLLVYADTVLTLHAGSDGIVANAFFTETDMEKQSCDIIITGKSRTTSKIVINNATGDEGIDGNVITIDTCTIVSHSADECIDADNGIFIRNSILDFISEDEEGIFTGKGSVTIENSQVKIFSDEDCIDSYDAVTVTGSSLDMTLDSVGEYAIIDVAADRYEDGISIDRKFNLYDADGVQLNRDPVAYSVVLVDLKEEIWCFAGQDVYRLVTVDNGNTDDVRAPASVGNVFRSLRNISFAGEGVSAMKNLSRALGSTVNLNRFAPEAREGYTFTGWYADAACTRPVTRLVVTGDMVIYAGWNAIVEEEAAAE